MSDLSFTRKVVPKELDAEDHEKLSASRQVPIRRTNTKVCWKRRKGRCHWGEKCWFAHSEHKNETDNENRSRPDPRKGGRTQIEHENNKKQIKFLKSPRERERDKRTHLWTAKEVMTLKLWGLWKLGQELKLMWPANTKRKVLCNLIMDCLKETGKLNGSTRRDHPLAKATLTKNTDVERNSSPLVKEGRWAT